MAVITTTEPPPRRPVVRRRYIEFHEQSYIPAFIRRPIQDMLTLAWTARVPILQQQAPAELAVDVLERVVDGLSTGGNTSVVDFCSGAGGPIQTIERIMNERRLTRSQRTIPFLLTDIHPHNLAWKSASQSSPTKSLHYVPISVDATSSPSNLIDLAENGSNRESWSAGPSSKAVRQRAGEAVGSKKTDEGGHFRTFFLAFHHFDEGMAVRVLKDAMLNSDGVGIFELQKFDIGSLLTITGLWPLTWLYTPTLKPTMLTLIFTYLIPIVPFILVLDGYTSAYRSREFEHIRYLAKIAHDQLVLEGKQPKGGKPWVWEQGSETHTWPVGKAHWVVGKRAA